MSRTSLLVIDDDKSLLKIIQDKLSIEGINVITACEGKSGVSKAISEEPDLIILDIMLPGNMNGFDVLEQLKRDSRTDHIPVIILTNLDSENKIAKDIGAVDYFVKSNTELDVICRRVKDILRKNITTKTGKKETNKNE